MAGTQERDTIFTSKCRADSTVTYLFVNPRETSLSLWLELIRRFVPNKKEGKFIHRIKKLHQKINWEIDRCPSAGVAVSERLFSE